MFYTLLVLLFAANTNPAAAEPDAKAEPAIVLQVRALMKEHKADEAIRLCNEAIRQSPDDGVAYRLRGKLHCTKEEFQTALPDLDRAVELLPGEFEPLLFRGLARLKLGKLDEAIADLAAAERINSESLNLHLFYGMAYSGKRDFVQTRDSFSRAIAIDPLADQPHLGRAMANMELGDLDAAIRDYSTFIELKPKLAQGYSGRAFALVRNAQFQQAMKDLDAAIDLGERNPGIYCLRGEIYSVQQQPAAALAEFRQAVAFPNAGYRCSMLHGETAIALGEYKEAVEAFTKALELRPLDISALRKRVICYRELGEHAQALEDIHAVVEHVKDDAEIFGARAFLLYETHQYADALADAEKALKLNPKYAYAYTIRAYVCARLDRIDEALAALNKAIELGDSDGYAYRLRADLYDRLGRTEEAAADRLALERLQITGR